MSRSSAASKMSGGFGGTGLFSNSSKYPTLLSLYCSSPTIRLPALSFTGLSGLLYFPDNFLVVSYRTFMFPTLAACSASSVNPSMYFLLSALMFFLALLLAFEYSSLLCLGLIGSCSAGIDSCLFLFPLLNLAERFFRDLILVVVFLWAKHLFLS